jgi:hypothetical protein
MARKLPSRDHSLAKKHVPAWPLAAAFYGSLCVVALAGGPAALGVLSLVVWLGAVVLFNRDPSRVLFAALVVGGAAALRGDVAGLSHPGLSVPVSVVACLVIYLSHDHASGQVESSA